jgi:hypothetical protein
MFSQREKQATDENAGVIAILEHLTFLIILSAREFMQCNTDSRPTI